MTNDLPRMTSEPNRFWKKNAENVVGDLSLSSRTWPNIIVITDLVGGSLFPCHNLLRSERDSERWNRVGLPSTHSSMADKPVFRLMDFNSKGLSRKHKLQPGFQGDFREARF